MAQMLAAMTLDPPAHRSLRMTAERVSWHLWNWEGWMFKRGLRRLWYPSKASGGMGRSHKSDFDEMVAYVDRRCAIATNTVINDLPLHQVRAIHHKHLAAVYRIPGMRVYDLDTAYAEACLAIGRELSKRGID